MQPTFLRLFIGLNLAALALLSLLKLSAVSSYEAARKLYQDPDLRANTNALFSSELAQEIKDSSDAVLKNNQSLKLEASYLIDLAKRVSDQNEKVRVYCRAFTTLTEVIKREPYDSKALVNWLDVAETIPGSDCAPRISKDQRKKIIELAINNDPSNTEVLYSAGLLYVWGGDTESSLPLFREVIRLSPTLSKGKESAILNLIDSGDRFRKIVPPRFPQITHWSNLVKDKRVSVYRGAADVIEEMQIAALAESVSAVQANPSLIKIHLTNIEETLNAAVSNNVRTAGFKILASTIGQKTELGNYVEEKAKLLPVKVVKAAKTYDTLPLKGVFSDWGSTKNVVLDTNETSLGFYKDYSTNIKFVELVSSQPAEPIKSTELKFYISNDNQTWKEASFTYNNLSNPNIERNFLVIEVKNSDFKYFKVNFSTPIKRATFWNNANKIINVFG